MSAFAGRIRDLAPADRPAWDRLWAGYLAFYQTSVAPRVSDATFARLCDPAGSMFALVAEQDGAVVGLVHCVLHPVTGSLSPYCYLEDLFVAPELRGGGAGRALIEAVYARADQIGAARVYWVTATGNARARALYDQVASVADFVQYRRQG